MILDELMSKWEHFSYRIKSRKKVFTDIYNKNGFSGKEHPISGIGSSIEQTKIICNILPNLFIKYNILSIIDELVKSLSPHKSRKTLQKPAFPA